MAGGAVKGHEQVLPAPSAENDLAGLQAARVCARRAPDDDGRVALRKPLASLRK